MHIAQSTKNLSSPSSKGIYIKKYIFCKLSYPTTTKICKFKGATLEQNFFCAFDVLDTACRIFAFENLSYLGEFKAELKKALDPGVIVG
jgi:hypothetical protein